MKPIEISSAVALLSARKHELLSAYYRGLNELQSQFNQYRNLNNTEERERLEKIYLEAGELETAISKLGQ